MELQPRHLSDYEGHIIRLTDERLAHILAHPEMVGMDMALEGALAMPDRVVQSPSDLAVRLYYRRYPATLVGDKLLCVVIKMAEEDAFIITAYLTDAVKRGRVLWERNR
jgi:hypothetical protein